MNALLSAMSRFFRRSYFDSKPRHSGNRKARPQRLCLEPLEDRTLPTAVAVPSGIVSWWTANNTAAAEHRTTRRYTPDIHDSPIRRLRSTHRDSRGES